MIEIDFGAAAGITAGAGLLFYLVACIKQRVWSPIDKLVEALGFGGLISVGLHMIYGAFHARELCFVVDASGKPIENSDFYLKFGDHTWEILVGGVCIVFASLYSLGWLWRRPSHQSKAM